MTTPLTFGEWFKKRRQALDLTQTELAGRAHCTVFMLRKIEAGERRPSKQLAGLFAQALEIPTEDQTTFIRVARGELNIERLGATTPHQTPSFGSHPGKAVGPIPGNLPRSLTPFIGREPELNALSRLLADPQCSLLTIAGPGGIGKTRLVIEAAQQARQLFPDGVWFIPLVSLNSPDLIAPAIAEAVDFKFQDSASRQAQLIRHLRTKKALLVLDNAEHLLDGAGLFTEIMKDCPQVNLLATSRERLNLLSEWVFEIEGLPVPSGCEGEQFEECSSVALFLQSARRVRAGFELREADRQWVLKICQIMKGMPLGIELSAAWVGLLSCEEIAREIEHNLDFLAVSMRDLPERHRSLRATLDHSWRLLSEEEKLILCRLAVFHGRFSREAAQEICGANLTNLSSLRNKSLISRTDRDDYALHEIVRQYATSKLNEDPTEAEQVNDRHAAYYVRRLAEWEQALQSSRQLETLNEMALVIDNLSQAWRHMVTSCRPGRASPFCADLLLSALFSLSLFYEIRCRSLEAIPLFRESVDYLKTVQAEFEGTENGSHFNTVLGQLIAYLGLHHYHVSHYEKSREYLLEAVQLLENSQSKVEKAQVQVMIASISCEQGKEEGFAALLEQSREVFREEGLKWWYALSTISLAIVCFNIGKLQESEALCQETYPLVEPGDLRLELPLRNGHAFILNLKGDYDQAEQLLQKNFQVSHLYGNYRFTASTLFDLGRGALARQRIEQAIEYIQKGIQLLTEFENMSDLPLYRLYLGKCFAARCDFQAARDQFRQVIKGGEEFNKVHMEYYGLTNIARTYFMEGHTVEALEIALALKHFPIEYKRIEGENDRLLTDLQAALPKERIEAVTKQVDARISQDLAETAGLAYALELATE